MDSKHRRLPFSVSGTRSGYSSPSSFSPSSSSLGSSRLYGRDSLLSSDRLTSASSALKPELDQQSPRFLRSSRDYSALDSRSPSWKLPSSLTSSHTSYDRPWADSPTSTRTRLTDSERRLGLSSSLVGTTDDGDSKRAKLSYASRTAYVTTPSSLGSTYSGSGLSRGADSSWRSYQPLSRSSSSSSSSSSEPLWSKREQERSETSRAGLADSGLRSRGYASSLYHPDRVTSTYAQGARPKETCYSSYSSSTPRESSLSRHHASSYQPSPLARDYSSRSTACPLASTTSSHVHCAQERTRDPLPSAPSRPPVTTASRASTWISDSTSRRNLPHLPPSSVATPPTLRQDPEGSESDGRRSTRRLLSRLFSRRSSQDSSSSPPSQRSFESSDEGGGATDGEETTRTPSVESYVRGSEAPPAFAFLRRRRQGLSPVQESQSPRSSQEAWRMPSNSNSSSSSSSSSTSSISSTGSSSSNSGSPSWLFPSLRTPLFFRPRRTGRDESALPDSRGGEGYNGFAYRARRQDDTENKTTDEDDDEEDDEEEDEDEEEEGAAGAAASPRTAAALAALHEQLGGTSRGGRLARVISSPIFRVRDNLMIAIDVVDGARGQAEGQEKDKATPSRDPEKLRKIQESLLLESSDEEEGDLCRICQMGAESASNPLIEPCRCTGSLQYVHQECIKKWLRSKISSGASLEVITTCELCKDKLHLNIENFDINELHRTHEQSEYEFINCGLYLVMLLHLCEQRVSDVLGAADDTLVFNLARSLNEEMDNLGRSRQESEEEEEVQDNRPSIDFCDLDDDLEDY